MRNFISVINKQPIYLLLPATKLGKDMFYMCLWFCSQGWVSRPRPRGRLGGLAGGSRTRPREEAWGSGRVVSRPTPGGCPGPHPGGCPGHQVGGCPGPHPGGCPGPHLGAPGPGGFIPACTEADTPPPQQMATTAGGMHPTGMHSCLKSNTVQLYLI